MSKGTKKEQYLREILSLSIGIWLSAVVLIVLAFTPASVKASEHQIDAARPKLTIRPEVSVRESEITLGSIARITSKHAEFDDLVGDLSKVSFGASPAPRMKTEIAGNKILRAIEQAGIPLNSFGYSIPRVVTVEREGHEITAERVLEEARRLLIEDSSLDLQLREVSWSHKQVIPVGKTRISVTRLGRPLGGKLPLRVVAFVDGLPAARFLASASVDDWREVPVLTRTLERGMLISPSDVELVRLNLFKQPENVAETIASVVGRQLKQRISAGETIKRSLVNIPPVITRGKKVTIIYRGGGVYATASGYAMDDGYENGKIRVKNENSRKIVHARVINQEEVGVESQ